MIAPELLPVTVPLAQRDSYPRSLPNNWAERPLPERMDYLRQNMLFASLDAYVSAGLEAGAQRLDIAAKASGRLMVHEEVLRSEMNEPAVSQAFTAGNTEHITEKVKPVSGNSGTGAYYQRSHMTYCVQESLGPEFNNPSMLNDVFGYNRSKSRRPEDKARILTAEAYIAMECEEWSTALRGLATVQYMYQAAGRFARNLVTPLIDRNTTVEVQPGKINYFWRARLAGTETTTGSGLAYQFGYRAKSGEAIKQCMTEMWGDDYSRNRNIFLTALNIHTSQLSNGERVKAQRDLRRPVFRDIGEGDFGAALAKLQVAAQERPELFSIISMNYLSRVAA